jgi:hypothetical protein
LDQKGTDLAAWHCCFGHASESTILKMASSGAVEGLNIIGKKPEGQCKDCIHGKHHKELFDTTPVPRNLLEIVHIDLMGPFQVKSLGGVEYMITIDDSAMSMGDIYFPATKQASELLKYTKEWIVWVERETSFHVMAI